MKGHKGTNQKEKLWMWWITMCAPLNSGSYARYY